MRVGGLLIGLVSAPAAAQTLHYEGGAGLATGTYILTERTSSWSLSTGLALGAGPVTFRLAVPVFYQSTTLVHRSATLVAPTAGGFRWAAGDPMVSVTFTGPHAGRFGVLLGMTAKVPVRDTASLGTGAWDVGGSLSASVILGRRALVSADVAYWHLGDPPGLGLTDPVVFGGTASYLARSGWGLSAGVAGSTPTIAGFAAAVSATASVLRPGGRGSLGLMATVGLTETAPDLTVALTWRIGVLK